MPAGLYSTRTPSRRLDLLGCAAPARAPRRPSASPTSHLSGSASGFQGYLSDTGHALLRKGAELLDAAGEPVGVALHGVYPALILFNRPLFFNASNCPASVSASRG